MRSRKFSLRVGSVGTEGVLVAREVSLVFIAVKDIAQLRSESEPPHSPMSRRASSWNRPLSQLRRRSAAVKKESESSVIPW